MTARKKSPIEDYEALPDRAQWALSYAAAKVPMSSVPEDVLDAGSSWGVIVQTDDDAIGLTPHGEKVLHAIIAHKDAKNEEADKRARTLGGQAAGEYLDSIGKSDLAQLSSGEWDRFCAKMCSGFLYHRYAQHT